MNYIKNKFFKNLYNCIHLYSYLYQKYFAKHLYFLDAPINNFKTCIISHPVCKLSNRLYYFI